MRRRNINRGKDFFDKFSSIISLFKSHINPNNCERVGVRYIDQIKGKEFENIDKLVRPEILGIYNSVLNEHISSSLRQTIFNVDEFTKLSARWGVLEKSQTYDPGSLSPIDTNSWVLDLDVFTKRNIDFEVNELKDTSLMLAELAYNFFRWSVKDDFLTTYRGEVD